MKSMPVKLVVLFLIIILSPLLVLLSLVIVIVDGWPFWFVQERVGQGGKKFLIWKFRSMILGAEKEQERYKKFNEASGPVFKIYNDPRLTKSGRFLFHTGLDELLQLFNILKGEMAFVGPRPLPVKEENAIGEKFRKIRRQVKPGIISTWIVEGHHKVKFDDWMKSDAEYVARKSFGYDCQLIIKTVILVARLIVKEAGILGY
jgi:lipopolysaccharide/colanic/teichoic acid biosynthesis glycosyltransferase